jgi:hypothetical protein
MKTWPALLLAPLLVLADQALAFSLVSWSCNRGIPIGTLHVGFFFATAILTGIAATEWRRGAAADSAAGTRSFLAVMATLVGALSGLVILAMWIPHGMLSPCIA